jgi:hypothetical protein
VGANTTWRRIRVVAIVLAALLGSLFTLASVEARSRGYSRRSYSTRSYSRRSSSGGRVSVRGYYRRDGTYVRPHTRSAPGSRSYYPSSKYYPPSTYYRTPDYQPTPPVQPTYSTPSTQSPPATSSDRSQAIGGLVVLIGALFSALWKIASQPTRRA